MPIGQSPNYIDFQRRINEKKILIGFFGLSKTALEMAVRAAGEGFKVKCFDMRDFKLEMIRMGISFSSNVKDSELQSLVNNGMISVSSDFRQIGELDFLSMPVPPEYADNPTIYDIENMADIVVRNMRRGLIICFENLNAKSRLKSVMDKRLTLSGFRQNWDYVFGSFSFGNC